MTTIPSAVMPEFPPKIVAQVIEGREDQSGSHNIRGWAIAGVLFAAFVLGFFDRISVAVLFTHKPFQDDMGTGFDPQRLGLLMTVFLFAYALAAIFLSFVGDIFGHRRSLVVCTLIWGLSMIGMGFAPSYLFVLLGRGILGLAEGPQASFSGALVKNWFPPRRHARANLIWLIGAPIGSGLGFPFIASYLLPEYGWRGALVVLGLINLVILVPLVLLIVRDRPKNAPVQKIASANPQIPYGTAVKSILSDWKFWILITFNFGALIYLWGLNSWLPSYLVKSRGIDLKSAGILSSVPFLLMFLGEVTGAIICDRTQRHTRIAALGMVLASVMMYIGTHTSSLNFAILAIGTSAFGWGLSVPTVFAFALRVLPPNATSAGMGIFNGFGNLVGALSPVLIGSIITTTGSIESGLIVLVIAPFCAAISMVILGALRYGSVTSADASSVQPAYYVAMTSESQRS